MQRNLARLELVLAGRVRGRRADARLLAVLPPGRPARPDRRIPRIAEEARRVVRGRILDRTGKALAENVPTPDGASERTYPAGGLAHLVGYHSERFGNSGIEERYDDYLSGARSADPVDRAISELLHRPTVGSDIVLTLDARIQQAARGRARRCAGRGRRARSGDRRGPGDGERPDVRSRPDRRAVGGVARRWRPPAGQPRDPVDLHAGLDVQGGHGGSGARPEPGRSAREVPLRRSDHRSTASRSTARTTRTWRTSISARRSPGRATGRSR